MIEIIDAERVCAPVVVVVVYEPPLGQSYRSSVYFLSLWTLAYLFSLEIF
jgi:hypothetical protein